MGTRGKFIVLLNLLTVLGIQASLYLETAALFRSDVL